MLFTDNPADNFIRQKMFPVCFHESYEINEEDCGYIEISRHLDRSYIDAETKWPTFCRWQIKMHFLEWKPLYFNSNFSEISSRRPNEIRPGLVEMITSHYLYQWWLNCLCIHALLDLDELRISNLLQLISDWWMHRYFHVIPVWRLLDYNGGFDILN